MSPKEDELYVAETPTGRLWAFPLSSPGQLANSANDRPDGGRLIKGRNGYFLFDSLAIDSLGRICIATLIDGGVTILDPTSERVDFIPMPDRLTTNICFGGNQLKTAYITLSSSGQLVSIPWICPGLPLNFLNK